VRNSAWVTSVLRGSHYDSRFGRWPCCIRGRKTSSGLRSLDKPGDKTQEAVLGGTGAVFCFVIGGNPNTEEINKQGPKPQSERAIRDYHGTIFESQVGQGSKNENLKNYTPLPRNKIIRHYHGTNVEKCKPSSKAGFFY
jgi:hypothetical protein